MGNLAFLQEVGVFLSSSRISSDKNVFKKLFTNSTGSVFIRMICALFLLAY